MASHIGPYKLLAELGRGGMGLVYKALDTELDREVAIKIMGEGLAEKPQLKERFMREARAMAAINHANIVQIYRVGQENNTPFIAMEFVEGQSLSAFLRANAPLSIPGARKILTQAAQGLAAAHEKNLIHRDIKPANILMTAKGDVKITDFGIARGPALGETLTGTGEFVGTPGYLSPEVCKGEAVTASSDIFSLGAVFFEMLTGNAPFKEESSPLGMMLEVVQSEIPDVQSLNENVDAETRAIVEKMLAKDPAQRYQDCIELLADLGCATEQPTKAAAAATPAATVAQPNITPATSVRPKAEKRGGLQLIRVAGWAAVLAIAIGLTYAWVWPRIQNGDWDANAGENIADLAQENPSDASTAESQGLLSSTEDAPATDTAAQEPLDTTPEQAELIADATSDTATPTTDSDPEQPDSAAMPAPSSLPATTSTNETAAKIANPENKSVTAQHTESIQASPATRLAHNVPIANPLNQPPTTTTTQPRAVRQLAEKWSVLALGDPLLTGPIQARLSTQVKQSQKPLLDASFVEGLPPGETHNAQLARFKSPLLNSGAGLLLLTRVVPVDAQRLNYYGQSSVVYQADIQIQAFDLNLQEALTPTFQQRVQYTGLNAEHFAERAVDAFLGEHWQALQDWRPE